MKLIINSIIVNVCRWKENLGKFRCESQLVRDHTEGQEKDFVIK
jgi:hypothetical protein